MSRELKVWWNIIKENEDPWNVSEIITEKYIYALYFKTQPYIPVQLDPSDSRHNSCHPKFRRKLSHLNSSSGSDLIS